LYIGFSDKLQASTKEEVKITLLRIKRRRGKEGKVALSLSQKLCMSI
jgi:hypothetical protein